MNLISNFKKVLFFIVLALVIDNCSYAQQFLYLDPKQPAEKRVEDLLSRMTLEEKIGQLNMPCVYESPLGEGIANKIEGCRKFVAGTIASGIGPGGGLMQMHDILCPEGPRRQAELYNEFQKIAVEGTRLKIPLIMINEGTHGLQASGHTIFPEGLAIGSTWNTDLVREIYSTVAKEARSTGTDHICTLVIEPNRDPRMGRNCEGYSEDSYMCSLFAKALVEGIQGGNIASPEKAVAVLCHFPGQTQPVSGLEDGEQEFSERTLRDVFLPPWEAGIKNTGALGVMATYPAIDGIPAHASEKLLTSILRNELGFEGLVLSEGGGISYLIYHHAVSTQKEAGALALKSGVDVGISYEKAYMESMTENVNDGKVNISTIDRAVRRILLQKFRLGLFENPYVDPNQTEKIVHTAKNQELALQAAREGIVLLRNENKLLPLNKEKIRSIAVIGPNADNDLNQLGDYTASFIPASQDIVTVLEGIKSKVSSKTKVTYTKGCNVMGNELNEIAKAKKAAKSADIAIVVVGENERYSKNGATSGEHRDISSLDLTGLQDDLVRAVYESGTPTIVILLNGRPLTTRWIAEHVPAIIEPWYCGEKGGLAIADVIFGDYNPSGRLPITIPRNVGQLPCYYNYKYSKFNEIDNSYVDMSATPLFEFGFGLSYTTFSYANLVISPQKTGTGGDVNISFDVTNTGNRSGSEVVQLYINDVISSVTTPVKELKGFEKVALEPGEKKTVHLKLSPEDLSLFDSDMHFIVEPGIFEVMVGSSSKDIKLKGEFEVKN
jgi:beta-glucosidase